MRVNVVALPTYLKLASPPSLAALASSVAITLLEASVATIVVPLPNWHLLTLIKASPAT